MLGWNLRKGKACCILGCSDSVMTGVRVREIKEMLVGTGIEGCDVLPTGCPGQAGATIR